MYIYSTGVQINSAPDIVLSVFNKYDLLQLCLVFELSAYLISTHFQAGFRFLSLLYEQWINCRPMIQLIFLQFN